MALRDPSIRASDADRDEVAAQLRQSLTEGRLTMEEFQERLDGAYRAKTYGDLDALLADLPRPAGAGPGNLGGVGVELMERWDGRRQLRRRRRITRFLSVNAACWVLWAASLAAPGHHHGVDPWPLFVTVPWGIVLLRRRPSLAGCHGRSVPVRCGGGGPPRPDADGG